MPTSFLNIKFAESQYADDVIPYVLEKPKAGSVYDKPSQYWGQKIQVLNEGTNKKKLFIIGDSHSWHIAMRFLYLYQESIKSNTSDKFPMIACMSNFGEPFLPCAPMYNNVMSIIQS